MLHLQQQMTCLDWIIDSAGPGVPESKNLADCLSKFRQTKFTQTRARYKMKMNFQASEIVQVLE